jgi:hypothetical protein
VRIHADRRRYSKYAAITLATALLGLLVGRSTWWIGGPVAVIFFALTVYLVRSATAGEPQITIDEDGLGGAELPRQVAWAEIATIEHTTQATRYSKAHFLRITPRGGKAFEISLSNLLTPPAAIVEAIEHFHEVH